ncbi:unnamed protein product [Rotaria sp. Silwood2]|nr:unnamed protein product [Rotaria sp. Silwood2]CAF3328485.1 unnamed protein product [Rotaria sp. Silwood2]CAF4116658.1 unnamed protein product [Rotaria sp. Silwood2]CAF4157635.1 unnamed protein product [Rotaria sp. Silwood2]
MIINKINSSKIDLASIYQNKVLPFVRLQTLSYLSILFSLNFTRVIFVHHALEHVASACIDKISSLQNDPFLLYDNLRRTSCRKYSSFDLTKNQRISYRK